MMIPMHALCHCGGATIWHSSENTGHTIGFTRGLCAHCDAVRCDAYPGDCKRAEDRP